MSEELTPLDHLLFVRNYEIDDEHRTLNMNYACKQSFDNIEKELIEKEQQDNIFKILKEVIEFAQMLPHIEPNKDNGFDIMSAVRINIQRDIENRERKLLRQWVLDTCFPKELKALKIIKEKRVDCLMIVLSQTYIEYNDMCEIEKDKLTQEEFNLLKEVLL